MGTFFKTELKLLKRLSTPAKIQDYLNSLKFNFEKNGETCYSPRQVMKYKTAHCLEGAIFAATALRKIGHPPLLLHLKATKADYDHVVAPFKIHNKWGAISKTNHVVLRYREPAYRDIRELTMSYFHEYFLDSGVKTLRSYTTPLNLKQFDRRNWMTTMDEVWYIDQALDRMKQIQIMPKGAIRNLRKADKVEIAAGKIVEWKK